VLAQKIIKTTKLLICLIFNTSHKFILKLYVNELIWCINSEWATLACASLNVLLASCVNVYRLRSCWRKTFWAQAVIKWC